MGGRNFPFAMAPVPVTDESKALERYEERVELNRRELEAQPESIVGRIYELSAKK